MGGWGELSKFLWDFWIFFNFAKPLTGTDGFVVGGVGGTGDRRPQLGFG